MWPWSVKMPTQTLLWFLHLLMLMLRIMMATVCCRFGSWGLFIKLYFCSDFEHEVWSRFWSWSSGEILKLKFSQCFAAVAVGQGFEVEAQVRFWSWIFVNILMLTFCWSCEVESWLRFESQFQFLKFSRDAWDFEVGAWLRFWKWKLIKIFVRTQPSGPLCLWQCFFDELQPRR